MQSRKPWIALIGEVVKAQLWLAGNKALSGLKLAIDNLILSVKAIDWEAVHAEVLKLGVPLGEWYREIFADENKQAQLAWDIQSYIKGAFVQAGTAIEAGNVVNREALWASIAIAMRVLLPRRRGLLGRSLTICFLKRPRLAIR